MNGRMSWPGACVVIAVCAIAAWAFIAAVAAAPLLSMVIGAIAVGALVAFGCAELIERAAWWSK